MAVHPWQPPPSGTSPRHHNPPHPQLQLHRPSGQLMLRPLLPIRITPLMPPLVIGPQQRHISQNRYQIILKITFKNDCILNLLQTQFSQKVYGQYAPAAAPQAVNPAAGQPATTPSYPTQYPNIPKAQYNAHQPAPAEFYTTSMGAPGTGINSPPMVGYPPCSLAPAAALATAGQPRLFTPQQQPVTSSQSYHPYRRQP